MVDEDWQLSKDSADAATAGNNFCVHEMHYTGALIGVFYVRQDA